jgi:hypothetical protein
MQTRSPASMSLHTWPASGYAALSYDTLKKECLAQLPLSYTCIVCLVHSVGTQVYRYVRTYLSRYQ